VDFKEFVKPRLTAPPCSVNWLPGPMILPMQAHRYAKP
jgi:hypothetical protein